MTTHRLYGIVIELLFGYKNVIYVVTDTFKSRKELGPLLGNLLDIQDIKLTRSNPQEWTVQYEDSEKYIRFTTGVQLTPTERQYSTEIYV